MQTTVLLLAENPYFGGITAHIRSILLALRNHPRLSFKVATFPGWHGDNSLIDTIHETDHGAEVLPMRWRGDWRVRESLRRYLDETKVDVVHVHGYRGALIASGASGGRPMVSTSHGEVVSPAWRTRIWQAAALRAMRRHECVIGCSRYTSDWLIQRGIPQAKVRSVLNSYVPADPSSGAAPGVPKNTAETILLYAGRLVAGKGLEHLMEAAALAPGVLLQILGGGPLRSSLESRANQLGAKVRFLGHHKDPGPFYESSDVVVLPSRMEALPMTLIEAGYFGKPSIATNSGGIPEVLVAEKTGLLYTYGDTAGLRNAIERLRSRNLQEQLGSAARSRWESEFSGERMARELAEIYLSAASSQ